MSTTLHRINAMPGLEVRVGGDGRTIHGLAVRFDAPTRISSRLEGTFTETFRRGAFAKTIREAGGKVQLVYLELLKDVLTRLPFTGSGEDAILEEVRGSGGDARRLFNRFKPSWGG